MNTDYIGMVEALDGDREQLKRANAVDLENAARSGVDQPLIDRLLLDDAAIDRMLDGVRQVDRLPDPVGEINDLARQRASVNALRTLCSPVRTGVPYQRTFVRLSPMPLL